MSTEEERLSRVLDEEATPAPAAKAATPDAETKQTATSTSTTDDDVTTNTVNKTSFSYNDGNMDTQLADQLTALLVTAAQNQMQLNSAMDRNLVANTAASLTTAVQQANAAMIQKLMAPSATETAMLQRIGQVQN